MTLREIFAGLVALPWLVFPGWWWARSRNLPVPVLAGFILGAVGLVWLVQFLDASGLGLTIGTLGPAWLAVTLAAMLGRSRTNTKTAAPGTSSPAEWWLLAPVILAVAVVAFRATVQPLAGADTVFRWNFLAEQMLARHSLAFYPPVSAADYALYAWPDGIAPVVAGLYFWSYALAGAARPVLTAPIVLGQFLLLVAAAHEFTRRMASARAAAIACALIAASPVILWGCAMGQESGLLALAVIGLLLYLPASAATEDVPAALLAGLAAALGGLAREYGLVLILFGLGLGLMRRLSVGTLGRYLLAAALGALPWYLRNWFRTGNPLFNLDVAGLFPVNSTHLQLMRIYQGDFGWRHLSVEAARIGVTNCMASLLGGIVGFALGGPRTGVLLGATILVLALWAASLGYTAAGFTYSLRVLVPALLLASIAGGIALAQVVPARKYLQGLALALFLFALDAAIRALVLPANAYRLNPTDWFAAGGAIQQYHQRPVYGELARRATGQRILVLGPAALLNRQGAATVPLWSPEVGFLWDPAVSVAEAVARLHRAGIGFALLNTGAINQRFLDGSPFFRAWTGSALKAVWADDDMILYEISPAPG